MRIGYAMLVTTPLGLVVRFDSDRPFSHLGKCETLLYPDKYFVVVKVAKEADRSLLLAS